LQIPAIVIRTSASPARRGTAESASFSLLSSKRKALISTLIRQSRAVFKAPQILVRPDQGQTAVRATFNYWLFAYRCAMLLV
jgi:hypothetical protein